MLIQNQRGPVHINYDFVVSRKNNLNTILRKKTLTQKTTRVSSFFTDNYNYSCSSILSPLSQSSSYSVDSGYSGLMEQSGSPPSQSLTYQQTAPLNHNNAGSHHIMQAYSDFNGNFFVKTPIFSRLLRMHLFLRHIQRQTLQCLK